MPSHQKTQEIDSYLLKLKSAKMRITEQRKAILNLFLTSKKPLTVHEAHKNLNKNKNKKVADLASLYRIFDVFEELEIIHQTSHQAYILCQHMDCDSKYHALLHCHSCNGFIEMHMPTENIESFATFFKNSKKFQIDRHPLKLNGLCANCQ